MFGLTYLFRSFPLMLCLLGFLWFTLINQLRVEWSVNPQYSYGWVVPLLCIGLLIRRWLSAPEDIRSQKSENSSPPTSDLRLPTIIFVFVAFLWLPTRLFQEANPEWRLISWALAIVVVVLTMLAIRLELGGSWACWVAFPICFFLVAVPWPTILEGPLIQGLTRANVATTIECIGWLGIPATQHGNVIEISTGMVGVNDACSGIRSFQSSIMISLFLGEFYLLSLGRRLLLLTAGFVVAFVFNVCRTSLLVSVASKQGIAAIESWHDPAGVTITVACTLALWGTAWWLSSRQRIVVRGQKSVPTPLPPVPVVPARLRKLQPTRLTNRPLSPRFFRLSLALLAWLVLVEVGVESWYRWHERRLPKSISWTMEWPWRNPTLSKLPLAQVAKQLLRYNQASSAAWREDDGTQWQMTYLRWLPGRTAVYLAKSHTPEICMPAAGHPVRIIPGLDYLSVHGLSLPFRTYSFEERGETYYVFYCLWEDRARDQSFQTTSLTYGNRLDPVLEGRRNLGQRSLEIVVSGYADVEQAKEALVRQLRTLIKVEKPEEKS
jgi:exosortase